MESDLKIVAIVQARMGSTRFPKKVMAPINGMPMIELLLKRLSLAKNVSKTIVATSIESNNLELTRHVNKLGFECFRGSEKNVLDRYYRAAKKEGCDAIIRITADCPLVDPKIVDKMIEVYRGGKADVLSNGKPPTFPNGLDVEIFSYTSLVKAAHQADTEFQREHVTPYLYESDMFKVENFKNSSDESKRRWTVDEKADLQVIRNVCDYFHPRIDFTWQEVLKLNYEKPELFKYNSHLKRNEGSYLTESQKILRRTKGTNTSETIEAG